MKPLSGALLLLAALVSACGGGGGAPGQGADCASALRYNGDSYAGSGIEEGPRGASLGQASDVCGKDERVAVARVPGVSPQLAIMRASGRRDVVYLNAGFFVMLESHPLHERVIGDRRELPRVRSCASDWRVDGTLAETPFNDGIRIRAGGRETAAVVRPRTRIEGFLRAGQPYLRRGDLVRASGQRCEVGDEGPQNVVRRIEPAP
jgi:hypothetical protein